MTLLQNLGILPTTGRSTLSEEQDQQQVRSSSCSKTENLRRRLLPFPNRFKDRTSLRSSWSSWRASSAQQIVNLEADLVALVAFLEVGCWWWGFRSFWRWYEYISWSASWRTWFWWRFPTYESSVAFLEVRLVSILPWWDIDSSWVPSWSSVVFFGWLIWSQRWREYLLR